MAHGLLPSALRPAPPGDHRRRSRPRDGGGRRGGEHRALHRATPALLAARSIGPRAGPAPGALHAGGDAARPEEDGAGQMNGLVLRSAIERARVSWRGIAAAALGAIAACLAVAFASPLSLAGGARVQQAAALFAADLAQYRAAPADLRAAPLVSAAAAGYEDRAFFHRPRWVPPLSPPGIARALVRNLRGIQQGGSTIPQQLAKLYLREGPRGDLLDKGREALFATWLVRQAAPDEIAGVYLNLSAATSTRTASPRPAPGSCRRSCGTPRSGRTWTAPASTPRARSGSSRAGPSAWRAESCPPRTSTWWPRSISSGTGCRPCCSPDFPGPTCARPSRRWAAAARCWRGRARSPR